MNISNIDIPTESLPLVALVGRPNVGKSTLFNRLVGFRKSITHETAGVTRDFVSTTSRINEVQVKLVDTGGYKSIDESPFDALVSHNSLQILDKADLILLIIDIKDFTAEDEEFIALVRKYSTKTLLVANKTDTPELESSAYNLYTLGFQKVIAVSAAHNRNIYELEDSIEEFLRQHGQNLRAEVGVTDDEEASQLKIALLGKPNVGKSSLSNFMSDKNRSLVSPVAGTTRDVVDISFKYDGKEVILLDTAGIRRKKKVHEDLEYYSVNRALKSVEKVDVVLLMISSEEGLSDQDKKIASQIIKHGKGLIFVLSKWDLQDRDKKSFIRAQDRIRFQFGHLDYIPIVPVSAVNGYNIKPLLSMALAIKQQLNHRIETSVLNKHLQEWVAFTPMKVHKTQEKSKILYMTQVSVAPIEFVAFLNKKAKMPSEYHRFLLKKIRENLGFSFVPITLTIRPREHD